MRRRTGERGFTLVEVLVALSLLGILAMLLHSGIRDGAQVWRIVDTRSGQLERLLLAQSFLRERTSHLGPPPMATDPATAGPWFNGAEDRLTITAPWLETLPVAGLYRMQFEAGPGSDLSRRLTLRWKPESPNPGGSALSRNVGERELVDGVRRLRFGYFGAAEEDGPKAWHPVWRSEMRPPDLVRVEIEFDDPARIWPTLVIAIP